MTGRLNKSASRNCRKLVLVLGVLPDESLYPIMKSSKGAVQFAADVYQRALIMGMCNTCFCKLKILNLPFVGSFPKTFKRFYVPPVNFVFAKQEILGVGFLNVALFQLPSRFAACVVALRKRLDTSPTAIIVYSAHLPFICSAVLQKLFNSSRIVIVILPDLPEFMSTGSLLYKLAKQIEKTVFRYLLKHVDGLVLVSRHMADELRLNRKIPHIVVEGMYLRQVISPFPDGLKSGGYLLYSGTLDSRYGIDDLLSAFERLSNESLELWICGEGDGREAVVAAANSNSKIKYLGQRLRNEVLDLQKCALALVNPRRPGDMYTNFSFPSKTIEYLASGRPTIFHRLEGIPAEYFPFAVVPITPDIEGLTEAIKKVCEMSVRERNRIGKRARNFILKHKSAEPQVKRILDFIDKL